MACATIDESLRQAQHKADEAKTKLAELEREVSALETRKATLTTTIATIEPGIAVGQARIDRLVTRQIEFEATVGEAEKVEQRLAAATRSPGKMSQCRENP